MDYLMYAMLQTARDDEAKALLTRLSTIGKTDTESFEVAYTYAAAPARYALERREWKEASELELIRRDFAWDEFGWARSIHHFARGIGAARSGQLENARRELAAIEKLGNELSPTTCRTGARRFRFTPRLWNPGLPGKSTMKSERSAWLQQPPIEKMRSTSIR